MIQSHLPKQVSLIDQSSHGRRHPGGEEKWNSQGKVWTRQKKNHSIIIITIIIIMIVRAPQEQVCDLLHDAKIFFSFSFLFLSVSAYFPVL